MDTSSNPPGSQQKDHAATVRMLPEDAHPHGIDAINDTTLDDTVDTDGKNRDASKPAFGSDNVINSQATDSNAIASPSEGLAGIESRPSGNRPQVAMTAGSSLIVEGWVEGGKIVYGTDEMDRDGRYLSDEALPHPSHVTVQARMTRRFKIVPTGGKPSR